MIQNFAKFFEISELYGGSLIKELYSTKKRKQQKLLKKCIKYDIDEENCNSDEINKQIYIKNQKIIKKKKQLKLNNKCEKIGIKRGESTCNEISIKKKIDEIKEMKKNKKLKQLQKCKILGIMDYKCSDKSIKKIRIQRINKINNKILEYQGKIISLKNELKKLKEME